MNLILGQITLKLGSLVTLDAQTQLFKNIFIRKNPSMERFFRNGLICTQQIDEVIEKVPRVVRPW